MDYTLLNTAVDDLGDARNGLRYYHPVAKLNPYFIFFRKNTQIYLSLPFGYEYFAIRSKTDDANNNNGLFVFTPAVSLEHKLNTNYTLNAFYSYQRRYDTPIELLSSPYYKDYRTIWEGSDYFFGKKSLHQATLSLDYKNVFRMVFASLGLSYIHRKSNALIQSDYTEDLLTQKRVYDKNQTTIWQNDLALSKGFFWGNSKIGLENTIGTQRGSFWVNGIPYNSDMLYSKTTVYGNCTPVGMLSFALKSEYSFSRNWVDDKRSANDIGILHNQCTTTFAFGRKLFVDVDLDHYHNPDYSEGKNRIFMSSKLEYKLKQITLSLSAVNLLNTKRYETNYYSLSNLFYHSYAIRERCFMIGIRLKYI